MNENKIRDIMQVQETGVIIATLNSGGFKAREVGSIFGEIRRMQKKEKIKKLKK